MHIMKEKCPPAHESTVTHSFRGLSDTGHNGKRRPSEVQLLSSTELITRILPLPLAFCHIQAIFAHMQNTPVKAAELHNGI
jgi:hypothetical protein